MDMTDLFDGQWHDLFLAVDESGGTRCVSPEEMYLEDGAWQFEMDVGMSEDGSPRSVQAVLGSAYHGVKPGEQRKIRVRFIREIEVGELLGSVSDDR